MITNFALSLSFDGIELLHRVPRGWRRVGQVDVASTTLDDDLKALREKALMIEPDGLRTKLILPLDQIKYLAIDGTLTTEADIFAALEGETPYALDELVIDSEKFGGRTHIAAVARETLQEAQTFAAGHGFEPVAFVAVPEPFTFQQEIFFGPTDMARDIVGPDAEITRDELPVMIVGTRIKSRLVVFDPADEIEEDVYKDDLAALLAADDTARELREDANLAPPEEDPKVAPPAATDRSPPQKAPQQAVWVDQVPAEYHAPVATLVEPAAPPTPVKDPLIPVNPVFAAIPILDPIVAEYHPPQPIGLPGGKASPLVAVAASDVNVLPKPDALAPTADRRPAVQEGRNRPALIAAGIAAGVLVLGGVIWSLQDRQDIATAPIMAEPVVTAEAESQPPVAEIAAPQVAPTLEAGLAIPELAVAEFGVPADVETGRPIIFGPEATVDTLTAPGPLLVTEADLPLAPVQQPPPAPPAKATAQASVAAPVTRGQVVSPDEAARIYAATGVWLRAPRFFDVPSGAIVMNFRSPAGTVAPERVAQPDMPVLDGSQSDLSFIAPASPPGPDATFARDANGFILATEEGTVTPDGAVVFAGSPDFAFTLRPELTQDDLDRMALLAPAPEGVVIIAGRPSVVPSLRPADARLPGVTDAPQTDNAVETALAQAANVTEAPTPGSVGLAGLALENSGAIGLDPDVAAERAIVDLRPRLRPRGLAPAVDPGTPDITDILAGIATDDAALRFDNSTSLAIALSLRPNKRPSRFGDVVAAARARQQTRTVTTSAPAATAAPVAAAAPVLPQHTEPVPGGVARAATQENAIRLHEISLIGVYGRPNDRRALVRLSNGRFVRVEVGSALDGGQVTAIGDEALNYVKRGRTYAIGLPAG